MALHPSRWIEAAAVIGAALACWVAALRDTDLGRVSGYGLLAGSPPTYYAGLALLAVGFAIAASRRHVQPAVLGCYVVALVVVLHATTAVLYSQPRYAWTYEHLGVIDYIAGHGSVDRSLDVYQSWPGFFALNAWLSRATGVPAVDYAAWAPLGFELANVAAILFALRGATRDPRLQWTAVWLFVVANWIGQDYLAPQAFGFLLVEVVLGLVLRSGPVSVRRTRAGRGLDRFVERIGAEARDGRPSLEPVRAPPPLTARAAVVLGAVCSVAVIVSDPLSPVMLILGLGALTVMTGRPPLWVVAWLIALEAWWVYVSYDFVSQHFRLFGLDMAVSALPGQGLAGATPGDDVSRAAMGVTLLLAAAGFARRWRAGHRDLAPLALVLAPALVVFLQPYGGEAPLRAYLFALPWLAFFAAAACDATAVGASWRLLGVAALLGATTVFAGVAGLDVGPLRPVLGVFIGLVAPGWLLLRATVGQRLSSGHAAALTVPLSLAICALSGTVLTLAGVRLTGLSLTLVVCAISLACLLVAMVRRTVVPPLPVRWPPAERLRLTPRTAMAGALAIAILAVGASTVRQIVRIDDAARASTPFVALTGKLQQATPLAGGVRVRVAFTIINSQRRAIRPRLEISVVSGDVAPLRRTLRIGRDDQESVQEAFVARCGDEVVANLTGDGVPPRTSTLRIACRG